MTQTARAAVLLAAVALAACGGGSSKPPPEPPPTAATVRLALAGVPAGTALAGAEVRVRLPAGVTPRLAGGQPVVALVAPLGASTAELFPPHWEPASRTLRVAVASRASGGMPAGALVDVECDVTAAAAPAASAYEVAGVTAADLSVRPVAGATLAVAPTYR
jgi:hypothetical protein